MKTKEELQQMVLISGNLCILAAMDPKYHMHNYIQSVLEILNAYDEATKEIDELNEYIRMQI